MNWKPYLSISLVLSATACQLTPQKEIQFTISSQPQSLSVAAGQPAKFEVNVEAKGQSLTYQWQKNGIDIPNATNPTYTLAEPTATDHGAKFTVRVSSSTGSLLSRSAVLVVNTQPGFPTIKVQPKSVTVAAGQMATFTVEAEGTGLKYAWYKNGYLISKDATYTTRQTDATYKDAKIMAVVYNDKGRTLSQQATLTVTGLPLPQQSQTLKGTIQFGGSGIVVDSMTNHPPDQKENLKLENPYATSSMVSSVILKFKPGTEVPSVFKMPQILQKVRALALEDTYLYQLSAPVNGPTLDNLIDDLQQNPNVVYATPNTLVGNEMTEIGTSNSPEHLHSISLNENLDYPNDPLFPEQWNMTAIQAKEAWIKEGQGSCNRFVNVAVIDTGILPHEDLTRVLPGYDFISNSTIAEDGDGRDADPSDVGHLRGTHLAGLIGADTNNGKGISGISKCSKILPVRVTGKDGQNYDSDIIDGLMWAIGNPVPGVPNNLNPARIVNMSFSRDYACTPLWQDAINQAVKKNALVIASIGTRGDRAHDVSPGNCNNVLAVGATNGVNDIVYYTNYGPNILLAPGGDLYDNDYILSTQEGDTYANKSGTAFAVPHVTGIAAMVLSKEPSLSVEQLRNRIINSAKGIPLCPKTVCGNGLVSALRALDPSITEPLPPSKVLLILRKPEHSEIYKQIQIDTVVRTTDASHTRVQYRIDNLEEGEYSAEVCLDNNDNGQCDPGEPYGSNTLSTALEGKENTRIIKPIQVIKTSGELWTENIFIPRV